MSWPGLISLFNPHRAIRDLNGCAQLGHHFQVIHDERLCVYSFLGHHSLISMIRVPTFAPVWGADEWIDAQKIPHLLMPD